MPTHGLTSRYAFPVCSQTFCNKSTNKFQVTSVNCTLPFPSFFPNTCNVLYILIILMTSDSFKSSFFILRQMKQPYGFSFWRSVFLLAWWFTDYLHVNLFLFMVFCSPIILTICHSLLTQCSIYEQFWISLYRNLKISESCLFSFDDTLSAHSQLLQWSFLEPLSG